MVLIMRGIQILGPASLVMLANEPDQLVSALIDADVGTEQWDMTYPPPPVQVGVPPPLQVFQFSRIGGCVNKVIRWAFEAQGMYGDATPPTNALGRPPPVDIYILDRRPVSVSTPSGSISYGPGSYVPVSLDWDPDQTQASQPPQWQADQASVVVAGDTITVTVANRGIETACDVQASVWWALWPMNMPPPRWNDATDWNQGIPQRSPGTPLGSPLPTLKGNAI
jgi:hypothetical protein